MTLLEQFKELSLHPKNSGELKGLILQLAVQGKLTANWRDDNPYISINIDKLSESLKINPSQLTDHSKNIGDLKVPETWSKAKFSLVFDMKGGSQPPKSKFVDQPQNGYVQLFQIRDFGYKPNPVYVPIDSVSKFCGSDDVMIGRYGASTGKIFYGKEGAYNVALVKLIWDRDILLQDFVYHMFSSKYIQEFFESCSRSAQAGFNKTDMGKLNICIPPIEEQKAIVEVVNTLFEEVEQLESLTKERIQIKESFVVSALDRLSNAHDVHQEWNFLQKHFSSFFTEKENIKRLRETILQLAVQGKLTAKWRAANPNTEPASELLKRIDVEIKKRRSVPSNTEVPDSILNMVIVDSWSTRTIANLLEIGAILDLKDGNHGNNHPVKADFTEKGLPFITAAQVLTDNRIDYDGAYKLAGKPLAKIKIGHAIKDDVIFTHKGSIGRVAIADRDCILTPQTTYYRLNQMVFDKTYIMYCLLSPLYKIQYDLVKKQSTRDYVSLKKQYLFAIPIPPLKEQQAIVEKVNSLMALCDELEEHIENGQTQLEELMKSCLAEVAEA